MKKSGIVRFVLLLLVACALPAMAADAAATWSVAVAAYPDKDKPLEVNTITKESYPDNLWDGSFDSQTGDSRYSEPRPADGVGYATGAFTTPVLATSGQTPLLIVAGCCQLQGISPDTGKVVWFAEQRHNEYSSSPVCGNALLFDNGALLPLDGGSGDRTKELKPAGCGARVATPVMCGGYLYAANNDAIACLEMPSGKLAYHFDKLAGLTFASPVATADGFVYFACGGKSYVLKSGPKPDLVATNDLADANSASMAVSGGRLFIRGATRLWCIGK